MSHPYKDQVLSAAQQFAYEKYPDPGSRISIEMEDVDNFCQDFNMIF